MKTDEKIFRVRDIFYAGLLGILFFPVTIVYLLGCSLLLTAEKVNNLLDSLNKEYEEENQ